MFGLTIVQPPHCGGWTHIWSNSGGNITSVVSNSILWNSSTNDIVYPNMYGSYKNTNAWNSFINKQGVSLLKKYNYNPIPTSETTSGYAILKYAKLNLGSLVSFGDIFQSVGTNCRKLKNKVTFDYLTINGLHLTEGATDTLLSADFTSLGFANAENSDTCGLSNINIMKSWLSRHVLSYDHQSSGRDTVRCQTECWSTALYKEEVIWAIR